MESLLPLSTPDHGEMKARKRNGFTWHRSDLSEEIDTERITVI